MAPHYPATYLNDHLAGSTAILELLDHVASAHAGTDVGRFAAELRAEVLEDRRELEGLMDRWRIPQSTPRKASAWLAEKLAQLKLQLDDATTGPLHLFEAMEALSLGIEGKRLLWRVLAAAAETAPEFRAADYGRLERRAEDQRRRVETVRLSAGKAALLAGDESTKGDTA